MNLDEEYTEGLKLIVENKELFLKKVENLYQISVKEIIFIDNILEIHIDEIIMSSSSIPLAMGSPITKIATGGIFGFTFEDYKINTIMKNFCITDFKGKPDYNKELNVLFSENNSLGELIKSLAITLLREKKIKKLNGI